MADENKMGEHERAVRNWAKIYGKAVKPDAIAQAQYQDEIDQRRAAEAHLAGVGNTARNYAIGDELTVTDGSVWVRMR